MIAPVEVISAWFRNVCGIRINVGGNEDDLEAQLGGIALGPMPLTDLASMGGVIPTGEVEDGHSLGTLQGRPVLVGILDQRKRDLAAAYRGREGGDIEVSI